MKRFWKVLNGFVFILYLLGICYLLFDSEYINSVFNLPIWAIPAISFVFIFYFAYRFIVFYLSADKVEREFTSIVNHTFRTPLTRINWISSELEKNREMPRDEFMLHLQGLNNATSRLLEIVDLIAGIKDIRSVAGYNFVATSFRDIVEKSIAKYRAEINKKSLTFEVSTFKDIPMLTVDLKKIGFVVDALIENSIVYTHTNGKVLIDCIKKNNKVIFFVADSGIGLSKMDKMRLFSSFYRGKRAILNYPDGMGLRLYLAKQIVLRHGGKIYAKSKGKDKGSVFFVELPINK